MGKDYGTGTVEGKEQIVFGGHSLAGRLQGPLRAAPSVRKPAGDREPASLFLWWKAPPRQGGAAERDFGCDSFRDRPCGLMPLAGTFRAEPGDPPDPRSRF